MIEPIYPLERGEFDGFKMTPRSLQTNHLRLEQADHRLGQRVIVRVAATADGGLDAGLRQTVGVAHGEILTAAIAVMDQVADVLPTALVDRLVQGVEHEVGPERRRHAPPDDASREDV